jgi:hypothetical protein
MCLTMSAPSINNRNNTGTFSIGRSKCARSCECGSITQQRVTFVEQSPFWLATSRLDRLGICNGLLSFNWRVGCLVKKSRYRTIFWANLMFCWPCIIVYQYSETNLMHFLFILLRIKGLYMFRALLAHPQEALHKKHLVYCVRVMSVGCTRIGVVKLNKKCITLVSLYWHILSIISVALSSV